MPPNTSSIRTPWWSRFESSSPSATYFHQDRSYGPDLVLNSVESHLGLLVQRAVGVYSFSHLMFQEYLTAQAVLRDQTLLGEIGTRVGDHRWREVWLMLASMTKADIIVLEWCRHKSAAQNGGSQAAVRIFLYGLPLIPSSIAAVLSTAKKLSAPWAITAPST
jgi:predicted NACHT family NTPase